MHHPITPNVSKHLLSQTSAVKFTSPFSTEASYPTKSSQKDTKHIYLGLANLSRTLSTLNAIIVPEEFANLLKKALNSLKSAKLHFLEHLRDIELPNAKSELFEVDNANEKEWARNRPINRRSNSQGCAILRAKQSITDSLMRLSSIAPKTGCSQRFTLRPQSDKENTYKSPLERSGRQSSKNLKPGELSADPKFCSKLKESYQRSPRQRKTPLDSYISRIHRSMKMLDAQETKRSLSREIVRLDEEIRTIGKKINENTQNGIMFNLWPSN